MYVFAAEPDRRQRHDLGLRQRRHARRRDRQRHAVRPERRGHLYLRARLRHRHDRRERRLLQHQRRRDLRPRQVRSPTSRRTRSSSRAPATIWCSRSPAPPTRSPSRTSSIPSARSPIRIGSNVSCSRTAPPGPARTSTCVCCRRSRPPATTPSRGYDGNEILDGLAGNDTMTGLIGEDIYLFGRGSGSDTIDDNGNFSSISADSTFDHLQFKSNVAMTDLTFAQEGNDLIIGIFGTSDQIRIKNQLDIDLIVLESGPHRALRFRRRHDAHRRRHGPAPAARRRRPPATTPSWRSTATKRSTGSAATISCPAARNGYVCLRPRLRPGHDRGERRHLAGGGQGHVQDRARAGRRPGVARRATTPFSRSPARATS